MIIYGAISVGRNLCWRGAAGQGVSVSAARERGQVASGVAQSSGPRVRVIAPEKEVMIGGVRCPSEGFRGRSLEELSTARKGRASAEDCIAVSQSARTHVRLGRGGGLTRVRRRTAAISELPFAGRRNSSVGTVSPCSARMVLAGPCEEPYRTHMQTQSGVCLPVLDPV